MTQSRTYTDTLILRTQILRERGVTDLLLCGFLTNCCIESTMRSAYESGLNAFTVHDCCCATSQEAHDNAVAHNFPLFSRPITSSQVRFNELADTHLNTNTFKQQHTRHEELFNQLCGDFGARVIDLGTTLAFVLDIYDDVKLAAGWRKAVAEIATVVFFLSASLLLLMTIWLLIKGTTNQNSY